MYVNEQREGYEKPWRAPVYRARYIGGSRDGRVEYQGDPWQNPVVSEHGEVYHAQWMRGHLLYVTDNR